MAGTPLDDGLEDTSLQRHIDAMVDAEARFLAAQEKEDCECKEGMFPTRPNRRQLLRGVTLAAAGSTAGVLLAGSNGAVAAQEAAPDDPTRVLGRGIPEEGGYGDRSPFETAKRYRWPTPTTEASWSMEPLATRFGIITPSGLHFERHHAGIPNIDPSKHKLLVHGMVDQAKVFTMADLMRFPSISRTMFIECSGNTFAEWRKATFKTVQASHGLTSTSEWTGVPLSTIFREVGIKDGAAWVLAEGADSAVMNRSVPLDKCWSDAFLAYGQNGEMIRPEQGYPLRLMLPGWEGNIHIKWLRRLEIGDKPFMTKEETGHYTDLLSGGKARQFTFDMEAKSVITFPSGEMKLPGPGFYEVTGLAWSGRGRISRVEISTDGGKSWRLASLQDPVLPICHTRFRFPWSWDGKAALLQSRCTDETGYTQPTIEQLVAVRGLGGGPLGSIYHLNGIQSWAVAADGSVTNGNHST